MKTIYGVKMNTSINSKLKNGYTMYDWVMRQKCFPSFCMRTLTGDSKITAEEIGFLKNKGCKIGLVLNDLTEAEVSGINGTPAAERAAESALEAGVPANSGIALFAEINPEWSVNHNWMISFAQTLANNGYLPGFIGNTDSSKNFNFDRQASHFVQATEEVNRFGAVFMATEPKRDTPPEEWTPYCPSAMQPEEIQLWACGKTTFDQIEADDVYARDETVFNYMWEVKDNEQETV